MSQHEASPDSFDEIPINTVMAEACASSVARFRHRMLSRLWLATGREIAQGWAVFHTEQPHMEEQQEGETLYRSSLREILLLSHTVTYSPIPLLRIITNEVIGRVDNTGENQFPTQIFGEDFAVTPEGQASYMFDAVPNKPPFPQNRGVLVFSYDDDEGLRISGSRKSTPRVERLACKDETSGEPQLLAPFKGSNSEADTLHALEMGEALLAATAIVDPVCAGTRL